jgi:hypothetical protein
VSSDVLVAIYAEEYEYQAFLVTSGGHAAP